MATKTWDETTAESPNWWSVLQILNQQGRRGIAAVYAAADCFNEAPRWAGRPELVVNKRGSQLAISCRIMDALDRAYEGMPRPGPSRLDIPADSLFSGSK